MDCMNCGTPNPDGATFCKKCGKRLDGMYVCPACGKLTPDDGDFCIYCGAGKSASPALAAVHVPPVPSDPAVCGTDGAPLPEAAVAEAAAAGVADIAGGAGVEGEASAGEEYVFERYRGLLKKASVLFAGVTALIGIIFVFLIDYSVSASYLGETANAAGYDIFYLFGDAYDAIDAIASEISSNARKVLSAGTALCTACCAAGMATTIICFLVSAVRAFKKLGGNSEKGLIAPCAATFISFVCTVVLFMMCVTESYTGSGLEAVCSPGGTSIAGIVLGAVFLAISVAAEVMANLKRNTVRPCALNCGFGAFIVAAGFVALGLMAGGICGLAPESDSTASGTYGVYMLFYYIAISVPTSQNGSHTFSEFNDMYTTELVLSIVLAVAAIIFCILLTAALSKIFAGKGGDMSSGTIKLAMLAGVFAVVCGALMIAISQVYVNYIGSDYESSLAVPIVIMVFGLLLYVASAVYRNRRKISTFGPYLAQ